jgi:glycosyltransferase involved in cell wall biosynthesis
MTEPSSRTTIVIPMLDESGTLPRLVRCIAAMQPAPAAVIAVDGGSSDGSVAIAAAAGWQVIAAPRGRPIQGNAGVAAATSDYVCIVHADTSLPDDAIAVIERTLADPGVALAGFTAILRGANTTRWGTSFHNWVKTWYAPLLARPHLFVRGLRLLFGDHAMFFRRQQFLNVGGFDTRVTVMEEAGLCIALSRLGRVRLVNRIVETSDRRVAVWGGLRANLIYFKVGMLWNFGMRQGLKRHYPDIR